jgi:hypothetical protein
MAKSPVMMRAGIGSRKLECENMAYRITGANAVDAFRFALRLAAVRRSQAAWLSSCSLGGTTGYEYYLSFS